jgi:putative MATE family efflux protein
LNPTFSYKNIWQIAYPIILGSIAQNVVNVTDTAFMGRVGEVQLGAAAIASGFYFIFYMIGHGMAIGSQIIVARRYGERNFKEIGKTIEHTFYFLAIFGFLMFLILLFFSSEILVNAISSKDIYINAVSYLKARSWGIIFAYINLTFAAFYIGVGRTRIISYSFLFMAIINIILDYILIFGKFGFQPMGISGAALASAIAEISTTVFFIFFTFKYANLKKYSLLAFSKFDYKILKNIFSISIPIMLQLFISMTAWLIFFLLIEKSGEKNLAISNIIRSLYIVLMIPIWGFASATNTLTSNLIGQNKSNEVMKIIFKTILMCFSLEVFLAFLCVFFPNLVLAIYTSNQDLINLSIPSLYVVNGALVFISAAFIIFNGVTGTGKTIIALIIEISVISIYLVYTYAISWVFQLPISVVWTSEYVYAILLGGISFLYLKYGNWKNHRI